jgi:hypothetical protein|nr:MAG TPA: hypothetical protein [Caudoviricetes sp.]
MALKRATAIPTIDVNLVTITVEGDGATEIALDTATKIAVEPQIETTEATKLVIKNVLKAQKGEQSTITGNKITLTDNVFTPELVMVLQGGTITTTPPGGAGKITKYEPPVAGSAEKGKVFTLCAYSAQYDASGQIVNYEKVTYPNCQGVPISLNSEDNVFRVSEYTINSAPKTGEAPYTIEYIDALPQVTELGA